MTAGQGLVSEEGQWREWASERVSECAVTVRLHSKTAVIPINLNALFNCICSNSFLLRSTVTHELQITTIYFKTQCCLWRATCSLITVGTLVF